LHFINIHSVNIRVAIVVMALGLIALGGRSQQPTPPSATPQASSEQPQNLQPQNLQRQKPTGSAERADRRERLRALTRTPSERGLAEAWWNEQTLVEQLGLSLETRTALDTSLRRSMTARHQSMRDRQEASRQFEAALLTGDLEAANQHLEAAVAAQAEQQRTMLLPRLEAARLLSSEQRAKLHELRPEVWSESRGGGLRRFGPRPLDRP
jgi:Spy/CpxP family protein refolding chaperone